MGKTNVLSRFANDRFLEESVPTIASEFFLKSTVLDDRPVDVRLWDTAGQELFRAVTQSFYKKSDAAIVCYDISSRRSFAKVDFWVHEIRENCREGLPILLLANKADLAEKREVKPDDGLLFAKAKDLFFMEVSAKTNEGGSVERALDIIIREAVRVQGRGGRAEVYSEVRLPLHHSHADGSDDSDEEAERLRREQRKGCCA